MYFSSVLLPFYKFSWTIFLVCLRPFLWSAMFCILLFPQFSIADFVPNSMADCKPFCTNTSGIWSVASYNWIRWKLKKEQRLEIATRNLFLWLFLSCNEKRDKNKQATQRHKQYLHSLNVGGQDCLCFWINRNSEEQEREVANAEGDETTLAVRHEGPEVRSHYALPPMSVWLIKILPSHGKQVSTTTWKKRVKFPRSLILC